MIISNGDLNTLNLSHHTSLIHVSSPDLITTWHRYHIFLSVFIQNFSCSSPNSSPFFHQHCEFHAWLWKLLRTRSESRRFLLTQDSRARKDNGDCNIECDATVTRPRLMMAGPGLVPSLISPPIKSCRNIFNWSILKERKEKRLSWHGQLWHSWATEEHIWA